MHPFCSTVVINDGLQRLANPSGVRFVRLFYQKFSRTASLKFVGVAVFHFLIAILQDELDTLNYSRIV